MSIAGTRKRVNRDRAVAILLDAVALGDKAAAEKWKVSERTIYNYREDLEQFPEFAKLFRDGVRRECSGWAQSRIRFLQRAVAKLDVLVEAAGVGDLKAVADAIKVVGDLHVVSGALGAEPMDEQFGADRQGPTSPPAAGGTEPSPTPGSSPH